MAKSETFKKGTEMRRKLMGEAYADKLDQSVYTDKIMEGFAEVTREAIFGTLWTRGVIDLKTRTLITVISDTATARTPELKLHLRMALNQGWTEEELTESILHLVGYVGAPSVREALLTAKEVFAEIRAEK
jgi:4-carboxymuconolactone decarboxylase